MMNGDDEVLALLERWDRQQEGYIRQREERFQTMFDVLASALDDGFTVIDAACGPGSLSHRLLGRFPAARVIAVDADVMLLEMARVLLAPEHERVCIVEADLAKPDWSKRVLEAASVLTGQRPAALVSTTALHWLRPGELAELYGAAGEILAPGGIVLNGDHMRFDARWPTLTTVSGDVRGRIEREAVTSGEDDWKAWWERAERLPRLAALKARRDAFYATRQPKRATSHADCSVDFHLAALRHAGFSETGTVWQQLDNYVVFGRLPG